MKTKLQVLDQPVDMSSQNGIEYICITDIARFKSGDRTDIVIGNWLRNRNTIEYLGIWEQLNKPNFKPIVFDGFKKQAGLNSFTLTPKLWIASTCVVGLLSKAGRYGGTYAKKIVRLSLQVGFRLNLHCI